MSAASMLDDALSQSRVEYAAHRWAQAETELEAVNRATAALSDWPRSTPEERKAAAAEGDALRARSKRAVVEHNAATEMLLAAVREDRA